MKFDYKIEIKTVCIFGHLRTVTFAPIKDMMKYNGFFLSPND